MPIPVSGTLSLCVHPIALYTLSIDDPNHGLNAQLTLLFCVKYLDNSSIALRYVSGGHPPHAVGTVGAFAATKCSRNNPNFSPQSCCERSLRRNHARSVE